MKNVYLHCIEISAIIADEVPQFAYNHTGEEESHAYALGLVHKVA